MVESAASAQRAGTAGRRPRVAMVSLGFGELSFRLCAGLTQHADVLLVTTSEQAAPHGHLAMEGMTVWAPPMPRLRQPLGQLRFQRALVKRVRAFDPDVVHVQHGSLWLSVALPFLRRWPMVVSIHDPRPHSGDKVSRKTPQWLLDRGWRKADMIVAHVPRMVGPIVEAVGVAPEKVRIVPHIEIGDQSLAIGVEEVGNEVLWFGRIWPYKGLDLLIKAQPLVTPHVPDARFVIAGQGEDFDRYRQMIDDPERFEIHNDYVSSETQAELFRRASVVALPYRDATQSGVVVNAYAFAKPVVATAVGGLVDQVEHGRTGLLVPPDDVTALAEAIVTLLTDRELRWAMGKAAYEKLSTEWSVAAVAARTAAVYEEVLQRSETR